MSNVCPSLKFIKVGLASNVLEKEEENFIFCPKCSVTDPEGVQGVRLNPLPALGF